MKAHETWAFGFGRGGVYELRIIATTTSIIGAGDCGRLRSCHQPPPEKTEVGDTCLFSVSIELTPLVTNLSVTNGGQTLLLGNKSMERMWTSIFHVYISDPLVTLVTLVTALFSLAFSCHQPLLCHQPPLRGW